MEPDIQYKKLRAAAINLLGVEDTHESLIAILSALHIESASDSDDGSAALALVVALIETGDWRAR